MTALTAVTVQNTVGVSAIHEIPPEIVLEQVRAVASDIGLDAVKVGMLGSREVIHAVALALAEIPPEVPVVVDPVMVAESGARLLAADAQQALIEEILPLAWVLTPNLPEARVLADAGAAAPVAGPDRDAAGRVGDGLQEEGGEEAEAVALLRAVLDLGPRAVVLTGGHRALVHDLYLSREAGGEPVRIEGERHPDGAAHGSGCTHSSLLAALMARGESPLEAARAARSLAGLAVAQGLRDIGAGAGPVDVVGLAEARRPRSRNLP